MTAPDTRTSGSSSQASDEGTKHASPRYPKLLTLDLAQDDHDALMGARYADRVPMADRIRALISLWREDPALAEAVSIRAQQLLPPPPGYSPQHRPDQRSPRPQDAPAS